MPLAAIRESSYYQNADTNADTNVMSAVFASLSSFSVTLAVFLQY